MLDDPELISEFSKRMCPNFEQFQDLLKVKGSYSNNFERQSFSIEIHACNKHYNPNCKEEPEIEQLLKYLYFTMYTVQAKVQFVNQKDPAASPMIFSDEFHSQFQLSIETYRDNNNFLRHNSVQTSDNRLFFLAEPKIYQFIDNVAMPVWVGTSRHIWRRNTTWMAQPELGYTVYDHHVIFGAYFFYSQERLEHSRQAFTFVNILAEIGGLFECFILVFGSIALIINDKLMIAKYIRMLYFKKLLSSKDQDKDKKLRPKLDKINFSFIDKMSDFKVCIMCWAKRKLKHLTRNQKLYQRGKQRVEEDMNVVDILLTLQKVKAGLSVLMHDQSYTQKAKRVFMRHQTLNSDSESGSDQEKDELNQAIFGPINDFQKFLNMDEFATLRDYKLERQEKALAQGG